VIRGGVRLEPADRDAWLAVAEASPDATFFHTPYWTDIAEASGEWVDVTLTGTLADGARVVYPLVARPRSRFGRLAAARSTFAGCYGGPIGERTLTADETERLHGAASAMHASGLRIVLTPERSTTAPRGFRSSMDTTRVIDRSVGFDAVLAGFHSGQRRAFRRGESEGLRARAARGPEDHDAYAALYEETLRLRGDAMTVSYRPEVLGQMAELAAEHPEQILLWLVEHDGRLVIGTYGFRWRDHVVMWHAATIGLRLPMASPLVTLLGEMMRAMAEDGVRRYDLNPSGGLTGVAAFKSRLGGEELPVRRLERRSAWALTALAAVNRLDRLRRAVR
jgi:CelD/BcsL family acetyltransferase involved in cellulose biosynthesis